MDPMLDRIREEAAAWFARRRDGAYTQIEQAAFEEWRGRSAPHGRAYSEIESVWNRWKQLQGSERMRKMAAAAMAATAPRQPKGASGCWQPWLAVACIAALVAIGWTGLLPRLLPRPPLTYSTALGEQRTERLPDGTRVTLNTETALQVFYDHGRRKVVLQYGEAIFDVVHDPRHPFVVIAGNGRITDIGTRFDVRDDSGTTILTLLEGRVVVIAQHERRPLTSGQQARYGGYIRGITVRKADPAAVSAWLHGRLDFDGVPLGRAIEDANRYSALKLRLGDPKLAGMQVGGSFRAGDNKAIAAALSAVFPVRVARSDVHEIVLMPR
jgi:transmembrane sensor